MEPKLSDHRAWRALRGYLQKHGYDGFLRVRKTTESKEVLVLHLYARPGMDVDTTPQALTAQIASSPIWDEIDGVIHRGCLLLIRVSSLRTSDRSAVLQDSPRAGD